MVHRLTVTLLALAASVPANAQLDQALTRLAGGGQSDSRTGSGLKEALRIGTDHAVDLTGKTDGFFRNQVIKILLPEKMRTVEKGLRLVGMGQKIDDFELSMNRAAEKAAPAARGAFKDALAQMTFVDARKILTSGNTSATEYFKEKTSQKLAAAFRPSVESAMAETGVLTQYRQLAGGMTSLPFDRSQRFDIVSYVVGKTLEGLFYVLGQEELKIRTAPAARITPLLKDVFGNR